MSKEERILEAAKEYMMGALDELPDSSVCPECDVCWLWRSDVHCERRAIKEAYIAGALGR